MMKKSANHKKMSRIKELEFVGDSLDTIKAMPRQVQQKIGFALHKVQCGETPKSEIDLIKQRLKRAYEESGK